MQNYGIELDKYVKCMSSINMKYFNYEVLEMLQLSIFWRNFLLELESIYWKTKFFYFRKNGSTDNTLHQQWIPFPNYEWNPEGL